MYVTCSDYPSALSLILGPTAIISPLHSPFHRFMRFCFVTHSVSQGPSVTRTICWWLPTLFYETGSLTEFRAHWYGKTGCPASSRHAPVSRHAGLCLPSTLLIGAHCCIQLLQGCWYLNSHQHIYMARTLVTELIFQGFFCLKKNTVIYDVGTFTYLIYNNLNVSRLSKQHEPQIPCN